MPDSVTSAVETLLRFELRFLHRQQGSKCASLLYFYRVVFRCNCKFYLSLRIAVTKYSLHAAERQYFYRRLFLLSYKVKEEIEGFEPALSWFVAR